MVILFENDDDSVWFTSNFCQKLCVLGSSEVVNICGMLVNGIEQFVAQVNMALPCGYRMGARPEVLYDTLLNFETEPENRVLIWSDSQYLFQLDPAKFELIFDLLVESAFVNRAGRGTLKENGANYQVNQRNVFIFVGIEKQQLIYLLDKDYFVNVGPTSSEMEKIKMNFDILEIKSSSAKG